MRWMVLIATCGVLLATRPIVAGEKTQKPRGAERVKAAVLERLDIDQDKQVQVEELSVRLVRLANSLDQDGDGVITADEVRQKAHQIRRQARAAAHQRVEARCEQRAERVEAALDRSISIDRLTSLLRLADADGDGELSAREGLAAMQAAAEHVQGRVAAACEQRANR